MDIPIIDTHQHLIYGDIWPYSWTTGIPALANKNFHYSDYESAITDTTIAATLFMETTPDDPHWREEVAFVDKLRKDQGALIQGLIANCRPEETGFERYLDEISQYAVHGLRRFLHAAPEGTDTAPHFIPNLKKLASRGLPFDLCVLERQLPMAIKIAQSCPEVQFVLDHCGVPDIVGSDFASWQKGITELAACENVACKISGVLAYCQKEKATTATVRPYVEHCIDAFGWDRVVWGSDWPVVTMKSTLKAWVDTTLEIIAQEAASNQEKLLRTNAMRIYKLDVSA